MKYHIYIRAKIKLVMLHILPVFDVFREEIVSSNFSLDCKKL